MLVAPSAYHRIQWRKGDKEALLIASNRLAVIGLAFLAVAMVAVVGLVTALITTDGLSLLLVVFAAGFIGVLWFGIPLSGRFRVDRNHDENHDENHD